MPDLIAQDTTPRLPAYFSPVLFRHQHKFQVGHFGVAEVGGHRPQFLRVQAIVKAIFQTLNGRPPGGLFVGLDISRSYKEITSISIIQYKTNISQTTHLQVVWEIIGLTYIKIADL